MVSSQGRAEAIVFSAIATDIENRCESTVLNYACGCFVPADQFKVAEAHSQIFTSFLTCWCKSSVVEGGVVCFVFSLFGIFLMPSKAEHIWDVTLCGKCSIQLQYKQSFLLHILKL